jgi:hypothetical protein
MFRLVVPALMVQGIYQVTCVTKFYSCDSHLSLMQGRLIDHLRNTQTVGLEDLQALILDEADRLLQMGFSEEVGHQYSILVRKWLSIKAGCFAEACKVLGIAYEI